MDLTKSEQAFLNRIAGRKKLFLIFSIASVVIALLDLAYHGLVKHDLDPPRLVLVLMILLMGRSHMRQYRSAMLLDKFKNLLDRKG